MHICFLQDAYPPELLRGPGLSTQALARGLVQRGHHVSVVGVALRPGPQVCDDEGVSVIRLTRPRLPRGPRFLANALSVRAALAMLNRRTPIDILEGEPFSLARVQRRLAAVKILRLRTAYPESHGPVRAALIRRALALADELSSVSAFVAGTARTNLALVDRPIHVYPNPIDTTLFCPRSSDTEEAGLILFVGGLEERKGVGRLLRAFALVADAHPATRLLLVGPDSWDRRTGGSFARAIRDEIPVELSHRIEFAGEVTQQDLPAAYARAEICAFPSDAEGWGRTAAEAMAMGKPVVTGHTGAGPELIEDGKSGMLCDPLEPSAIANCFATLLRNGSLRAALGQRARDRALQCYSIGRIAEQHEAFYEQCLARAR